MDGAITSFVYDGVNIVQELTGIASNNSDPSTVRASYISGGIDEVFAQTSGAGTTAQTLTYLSDALGSTIQLANSAGVKVVSYSYDPYGNTTADTIHSSTLGAKTTKLACTTIAPGIIHPILHDSFRAIRSDSPAESIRMLM